MAKKLRSAGVFLFQEEFFRILDWLGLNFNAINLKFLQIVGHKAVYNILNLQINSLNIEVSASLFIPQKSLTHFGFWIGQALILMLSICNFYRLQAIKLFTKIEVRASHFIPQIFYPFWTGQVSILMLSICNFHGLQAIKQFITYKILDQLLKN